ncbi:MAG TPA: hypothetical protein EYP56_13725 [Planctomycetaceae bacterium]|nr:hypothetical protein [Planctomycetaceae bacterium]HIQ21235.1 hypothetical protein [Planctomycetota bacterium]
MPHAIRITVEDVSLAAELNDSPTAAAVLDALPIEASGSLWGEEIYFSIPVRAELAPDARADMEVGELAYWPPGNAFCIFFGPTPASTGPAPRAASEVNPIGRVLDDVEPLKSVPDGAVVRIERA